MINTIELDKKLMFQDAWNHNTPYSTLLICNEKTIHKLALTLGKDTLDDYQGHKIKIDNDLKDDEYIISTYKKGEEV